MLANLTIIILKAIKVELLIIIHKLIQEKLELTLLQEEISNFEGNSNLSYDTFVLNILFFFNIIIIIYKCLLNSFKILNFIKYYKI